MLARFASALSTFLWRLVAAFVVLSIFWVLLYRFLPPPMTWLQARDAIAGRHIERQWVPLTAMAKAMPRAVITAEDAWVCSHNGFDFNSMQAAFEANAKGRKLRGGSTISQQTAKNAFLWPARSYVRKALEAWFTLLIEVAWGKPRIMEVYLNIVEMGPGIYGMEAAAEHYFGTTANKLTPRQAARLAAILPQPLKRNAARPSPAVRRLADRIERRIGQVARLQSDACLWR